MYQPKNSQRKPSSYSLKCEKIKDRRLVNLQALKALLKEIRLVNPKISLSLNRVEIPEEAIPEAWLKKHCSTLFQLMPDSRLENLWATGKKAIPAQLGFCKNPTHPINCRVFIFDKKFWHFVPAHSGCTFLALNDFAVYVVLLLAVQTGLSYTQLTKDTTTNCWDFENQIFQFNGTTVRWPDDELGKKNFNVFRLYDAYRDMLGVNSERYFVDDQGYPLSPNKVLQSIQLVASRTGFFASAQSITLPAKKARRDNPLRHEAKLLLDELEKPKAKEVMRKDYYYFDLQAAYKELDHALQSSQTEWQKALENYTNKRWQGSWFI